MLRLLLGFHFIFQSVQNRGVLLLACKECPQARASETTMNLGWDSDFGDLMQDERANQYGILHELRTSLPCCLSVPSVAAADAHLVRNMH